jgi:hypothetical protein
MVTWPIWEFLWMVSLLGEYPSCYESSPRLTGGNDGCILPEQVNPHSRDWECLHQSFKDALRTMYRMDKFFEWLAAHKLHIDRLHN